MVVIYVHENKMFGEKINEKNNNIILIKERN